MPIPQYEDSLSEDSLSEEPLPENPLPETASGRRVRLPAFRDRAIGLVPPVDRQYATWLSASGLSSEAVPTSLVNPPGLPLTNS
jgi:hypothetical protein